MHNNVLEISDTFLTRYVSVGIIDEVNLANKYFFVNHGNSIIRFANNYDVSFLNSFKIYNAQTIDDFGQLLFCKFAQKELNERDSFVKKYQDFSKVSDSLNEHSMYLEEKVRAKQIEFIKKNNRKYYSLWAFKYYFVNPAWYPPDTLLNFYEKNLQNNFLNTFEDKEITKVLKARLGLKNKPAPDFSVKDYEGKIYQLSDFHGKYLLINLWAPWCKPCIEELPYLNSIYADRFSKQINIMSIDCDTNYPDFLRCIKDYDMGWINIFNDQKLRSSLGEKNGLPQLILINESGKVVYSREEDQDFDLKKLRQIIDALPFKF